MTWIQKNKCISETSNYPQSHPTKIFKKNKNKINSMETFNRSPRMLSPKIPPTSSEGLRPETSPSGARFSAFHPFFVWKTESLGRNHEDTRFERYTPRKTNGCNPEIKVWFQMMFPLHFAENFYRVSCSFVFFPGSTFSCW